MKKRFLRGLCIVLFLGAIYGVIKLITGASSEDVMPEATSASEAKEEIAIDQLPDLSTEFACILAADRNFYCGYSIDQSFLLWFEKQYGEEMVKRIAASVQSGNADSNLWYELTGNTMHVLWLNYCESLTYSSYLLTNVHYLSTASSSAIYMDFAGDVNFDEDWPTMLALHENGDILNACIMPEVQQEFQSADLAMVNNEFTYSTGGSPLAGKSYTFRANPSSVSYLQEMGIDIVNLANNHVWDYGEDALLDTLSVLQEAGIDYVGAGEDLKEASAIQYYVMNGRKIAIVSATQIEKSYKYTKEATNTMAGVLKTLNPDKYVEVIKRASATSDYVICNVHWGTEAILTIGVDQRELAQQFVDAGADIVIGNHSHRLQGIHYVDNVPVIHSLGNFWFCTGKLYTTILQVRIDDKGELMARYIPCLMEDTKTSIITDEVEKQEFYRYVCDTSEGIAMDENGWFYPTLTDQFDKDMLAKLPYHSGMAYKKRSGSVDLLGRSINIVGDK